MGNWTIEINEDWVTQKWGITWEKWLQLEYMVSEGCSPVDIVRASPWVKSMAMIAMLRKLYGISLIDAKDQLFKARGTDLREQQGQLAIELEDDLAHEASNYKVPDNTWETCGAPEEAVAVAIESAADGVPTAVANHPNMGWVVLASQEQGPVIIWPPEFQ